MFKGTRHGNGEQWDNNSGTNWQVCSPRSCLGNHTFRLVDMPSLEFRNTD